MYINYLVVILVKISINSEYLIRSVSRRDTKFIKNKF